MTKLKYLVMPEVWLLMLDRSSSELHPLAKKLKRFIEDNEEIYITGLILHDVIHHVASKSQKEKVYELLNRMNYVDVTKEDFYQASLFGGNDLFANLHKVIATRLEAKILEE